jgi:phage head maturation protease
MTMLAIHGVACPWNVAVHDGGRLEAFDRECFDSSMATPGAVQILAWGHDTGRVVGRCVELFSDAAGLNFVAEVDAIGASEIRAGRRWCSVGFSKIERQREIHGGANVDVIASARLDHVLLTNRPAFETTAAWIASEVENLDWRRRWLAECWDRARVVAAARRPKVIPPPAQPIAATMAAHRRPPPNAAMAAPGKQYFGVIT